MIFSFLYENVPVEAWRTLPDVVLPVIDGLLGNGHQVLRVSPGLRPPPAVNVLVEGFADGGFVDGLLRAKAERGTIFGILCADEIAAAGEGAAHDRIANLRRLLPAADFVWTLKPQVAALEAAGAAGNVAALRLGFSERALDGATLVPEPGLRGLDAVLYGDETPYRAALVEALEQRGLQCLCLGRISLPPLSWRNLPPHLAGDLLTRAKVVIDAGERPGRRYEDAPRLWRALHSGAVVVSEQLAPGGEPDLQRFAAPTPYEAMAEQCERIVRSGLFVELGLAALAKFRHETSMRATMAAALRLPVFERLARA